MNRTPSQVAKVLGADVALVKSWALIFRDYLSPAANPPKGKVRFFNDGDLLVLCYVWHEWEDNPDVEVIKIGLNHEEHFEEPFIEHLYMHTPLLQEPPDDLDETWRHGFLWVGGHGQSRFELSRNYRYAAEKLLDQALKDGEAHHWLCPVLFTYRHTLELYLKTIGNITEHTHSLAKCVELVEKLHGEQFPPRARRWIEELDKIDPHPGTIFRYEADDGKQDYEDYWVDLRQFKFAMRQIFEMIDRAILRDGAGGKPSKKKK
jgi:hypothetical protein